MTLADIGVVSSIVGTVAIVASLFYLATQTRHNVRAMRSATFQAIISHMATVGKLFIDDPTLGGLYAATPDELRRRPPEDQGRFSAATGFIFRHYDSVYYHYLSGALETDQWEGFRRRLRDFLVLPAVAAWWQESKGAFSDRFVAYVDAELDDLRRSDEAVQTASGVPD